MRFVHSVLLLTVLLFSSTVLAREYGGSDPVYGAQSTSSCLVVGVHDGDTLTCRQEYTGRSFQVRLANIDAPEVAQTFGAASREMLKSMVLRQRVALVQYGESYGRVIAVVSRDGVIINRLMVKNGGAWAYTQYQHDPKMPALERQARARHLGLWADANPVAPWDFRHQAPSSRPASRQGMTTLIGAKGVIHNFLYPDSRNSRAAHWL